MFAGVIISREAAKHQRIWAERGVTERRRIACVIRAEGRARVQRPEAKRRANERNFQGL